VGRSNRAQAEKNRQRIVDVADAALRKSGTQAVTIAEVMTQAGMTQGGFYKHFQSKDEKPPEKTCPMVALARDAEPHQASQALNAAYQTGVEQLFETFAAIAAEGQLKEISRERLVLTFAAMVGANMLSRATGDKKWVKGVKQALFDQPSSQPPASLRSERRRLK
jgi:TetR/AcrR family transcriptional repressor of nem operon